MTVIDKVREAFRETKPGERFTTAQIKQMVHLRFGVNTASVIPGDYSYNMTNKGKVGALESFNIFIQIKRGLYEYAGEGLRD